MNKTTMQYANPNAALSRGKSFRFLGEWLPNQEYKNDCYVQDFVEYDGILWGCLDNNVNKVPRKCDRYWKKALVGIKGDKGKEIVAMYQFNLDSDEQYVYVTIMVVYSDGTNEPFEFKVEKMKGDPGKDGRDGRDGQPGATGPKGDPGTPGSVVTIGEDGYWYIDGVKTETSASFQGVVDDTIRKDSPNPITSNAVYWANRLIEANLQEINERINEIQTGQVTSVNGEIGDVVITAESIGAITEQDLNEALSWK